MTTDLDDHRHEPERCDHLTALREVARSRRELDEREYFHVMQARAAGVSWEGVAAALGVSRQAVHRRFRGRGAGDGQRRREA